jgi:phage regulator Rha-like protein
VSQFATPRKTKNMKKNASVVIVPNEVLINKIYILRKQKVMLDKDLAELYGIIPRRLREQVKRNINSFPEHFMFQLTEPEVEMLISQNVIASTRQLGGSLPYVFTEHGVLMLANVLRSEQAIQVSIKIIEVFVKLREMLLENTELRLAIEKLEKTSVNNTKNIELFFQYIDELSEKQEKLENKKPKSNERNLIGYKLPKKK